MNRADFVSGHPGRLLRQGPEGSTFWAYVPAPLPPEIGWTESTVSRLSAADRAIGLLAGTARSLPNPHLLIGSFIRREAVLSSRIEGTQASLTDLYLFEARPESAPITSDVREVANYVKAVEHGLARLTTLPMSKRLIREMHGILMRGVRGQERTPGEFRRTQNWIGPPGCTLSDASFVPPPPEEMHACLDEFERFLHAASSLPPLVRMALIHYQFEAIHPFLDGNGRIGRLLITLLLCAERVLPEPLLYLSAFIERHRSTYYECLSAVSRRGAWDEWVEFFLRGVTDESIDAVERAGRLIDLRTRYRETLQRARASALLLRLVDSLFDLPAITAASARTLLGVTPRAAHLNIEKLVRAGVLREATGMARNRVWVADEIMKTIEQDREAIDGSAQTSRYRQTDAH